MCDTSCHSGSTASGGFGKVGADVDSGNMADWRRVARPSSSVDTVVVAPLWVLESVAGYFHLCGIQWFLSALVIVARLRLR